MNMMDKAKGYVQSARNVANAAAAGLKIADTKRRVAAINEEQARLRAAAPAPDPAAAVRVSMAASRPERLAPPPAETGLPRRPVGPQAREVRRAGGKTAQELADEAAGLPRR